VWIVHIALRRPYTFIVLALLILVISPLVIRRTPTDIFPNIDIPVVSILWNYTGLNAEEMEQPVTSVSERILTTVVNDIDHIESQTMEGLGIIKVFFHPGVKLDAAFSQVSSSTQPVVRLMPPGTTPPLTISYNASSVPILQLALSGNGLAEQQLNDIAMNYIRTQLATVPGAAIPWPYGGKQRQIMIDLQLPALQSKGLSPADVVTAVGNQNLILPGGTSKIGPFEYDVDLNGSPRTVEELNDLPIRANGRTAIYVRDVAHVRDGFAPQTNIVRRDGHRGSLLTVMKVGAVSTLDIVQKVREALPRMAGALPPTLRVDPLADQSVFVRDAVNGVLREAVIAACLTAMMILLFLGSWRSTLIIAISIPLSILTSVCCLSAMGETINIMTLGGLALAVGILVDDATVTIENIERNFEQGKDLHTGILDGAAQIAVPALVSTLCICIVFLPMFFLTGVARFLFIPLAEAVVFAMLASYVLSRTLVPTLAMYLLKIHAHRRPPAAWDLAGRFQRAFERTFAAAREGYRGLVAGCVRHRRIFAPAFLGICASAGLLLPWLGQDFFPVSDSGQLKLHLRAKTGTRIEETARLCDLVEASLRRTIPPDEVGSIIDNIGLPYSSINLSYSTSAPIGPMDADILVSLKPGHRPTADYMREMRRQLPLEFPGVAFYFLPADIISQILNFGLPAPIDVQVVGLNVDANRAFADRLLTELKRVPGTTDLRIQQVFDQPKIHLFVDRTKAAQSGFTQLDVASSMLISLSGSFQTTPTFWLDPRNGINYSVVTQAPQYSLTSLEDLQNIPISGKTAAAKPEILGDFAAATRGAGMALLSHYDLQRVVDIYGSVQDRDLGGAAGDIYRIVDRSRWDLPRGSQLMVRGQIETMQSSFQGLLGGLVLAVVLVYFLIVVNFQSWLDPFIILTSLPAALAGIVIFLFATRTTVSVPALMGAIMSVGVATANSILVVSFAKDHLAAHGDAVEAAVEAGFTRFRPVLMTALAMIIGMVPMALGLGEGGEQNAPLGRAVIGGLLFATVATLFFVPTVFSLLHRSRGSHDLTQ
jgi:multidrug efflux pump subunit AcrB